MTDQNFSYSEILEKAHKITVSTAVAFLSVQKSTSDKPLEKPVGFSIVRLIGQYYEKLECSELIDLSLEPSRIVDFIFSWSTKVGFRNCYIDVENFNVFGSHGFWQGKASRFNRQIINQKYNLKAPNLLATQRLEDPIIRQQNALTEPIKTNHICFAASLRISSLEQLKLLGEYPRIDALAGATERAIKIQKSVFSKISHEQKRIIAANGKSVW